MTVKYKDYHYLTMAEVMAQIQNEYFQTSRKIISIETLENYKYLVRVWYTE